MAELPKDKPLVSSALLFKSFMPYGEELSAEFSKKGEVLLCIK
jgi:hypothetical protein